MKHLTILIFIACSVMTTQAQVSVSARFLTNNFEPLDVAYNQADVAPTAIELGIGYWLRFTKVRMEVIPELSFTKYNSDLVSASAINGQVNLLFYSLDFYSDCGTCPTFSKDGGLVKKGFHWIVAPGVTSFKSHIDDDDPMLRLEGTYTSMRLALGAGLDIGLSNLLTITPFATYNLGSKVNDFAATETEDRLKQIHIGLRSVLRFDKDKW